MMMGALSLTSKTMTLTLVTALRGGVPRSVTVTMKVYELTRSRSSNSVVVITPLVETANGYPDCTV